jgi:hypothetical protein
MADAEEGAGQEADGDDGGPDGADERDDDAGSRQGVPGQVSGVRSWRVGSVPS